MIQEIKELSNAALLDLYAKIVRLDHYDPHCKGKDGDPKQDDIKELILARLEKTNA